MPELPVPSEKLINYNQSIHQVRGIQTAPTSLESTSLVFTYGLGKFLGWLWTKVETFFVDIFFTRVTPSKTFDVLKDDFDFLLIVAVLVGLIVASYIGKLLAARKQLNAVWKWFKVVSKSFWSIQEVQAFSTSFSFVSHFNYFSSLHFGMFFIHTLIRWFRLTQKSFCLNVLISSVFPW